MDRRKDKKATQERKRNLIQLIWAIISNGYIIGFIRGTIYQGKLKAVCVPGLNCYSCMGALGSCPVGALQAELGVRPGKFPFYMFGFFMIIGGIFGRLVCGFMCPFGLLQDLLYKIPFPKKIRRLKGEKVLVKIKYVVLLLLVILLPIIGAYSSGVGDPAFCKYICPQGTLEGGIPHIISNPGLRQLVGVLFSWKVMLLIAIILLSIVVYRPFCKILCPLGAIYSLFNRISVYRYRVDEEKCIDCGVCSQVCLMNVNPLENINSMECIRCGKCKAACPVSAIDGSFRLKDESKMTSLQNED